MLPRVNATRTMMLALSAVLLHAGASAQPTAEADPLGQWLGERRLVQAPQVQAGAPTRSAAADLVVAAMNFLDLPYQRGGNGTDGFDCSGFTRHLFEHHLSLLLPRRSDEQARFSALSAVSRETLEPGDLVFFNTLKRSFSHVGLYIGDGRFIHSPRSGSKVRIESMREAYWARRFDGARRAEAMSPPGRPKAESLNAKHEGSP